MSKKNKKSISDWPFFRIILTIASTALSIAILMLSAFTVINIYNNDYASAPNFMIWIFLCLGLMSVVLFLKNRTKINLIKCLVLIAFDITLGIIVLFAKDNPYLFSLTAGLYCITIVISRLFSILQNRTARNIIFNGLIILFAIALGIGLFVSSSQEAENIQNVILVECVFIAIVSFVEAMSIA